MRWLGYGQEDDQYVPWHQLKAGPMVHEWWADAFREMQGIMMSWRERAYKLKDEVEDLQRQLQERRRGSQQSEEGQR